MIFYIKDKNINIRRRATMKYSLFFSSPLLICLYEGLVQELDLFSGLLN